MRDVTKDSSQGNRNLHCKNCGKTFSQIQYFKIHQKAKTKDPNVCLPPNAIKQSYDCDKCTATFKKKCGLYRHVREVHEKLKRRKEKPSKCGICQKEFVRSNYMKTHLETVHENLRQYECEICNHKGGIAFIASGVVG